MATEQHVHATKLPALAVTIPASPTHALSAPSSTLPPLVTQAHTPGTTALTNSPSLGFTGTATALTPTSGMHSPPLSNTVEDEDMEMTSAAAVNKLAAAAEAESAVSQPKTPRTTTSLTPQSSQTTAPGAVQVQVDNSTKDSMASTVSPGTDTKGQADSKKRKTQDHDCLQQQEQQQHQQQDRAKTIEHILQQGKILKVSRRLRTRLEYAILKIRRGWSKYTLQEVESLIQPACSPRISVRQIHKTLSRQSSPRLPDRKRVKHVHPDPDSSLTPHHRSLSDPSGSTHHQDLDLFATQRPSAPATPTGHFRSRMPSLSQYKDSELYQPAKSLMEIATSRPEPGYMSPYHRPEPQEIVQSAAQAAESILLLSSPTRPPPRALNPTHSPLGDWNVSPHLPSHPSPLAQLSSTASRTPSPDRTIPGLYDRSAPLYVEDDRGSSQAGPLYHGSKSLKPYANLYGMGHEPSSPSPLSTALFPPSEPLEHSRIHSRSSSPTLKRAVRFAAAATNASESTLSVDCIKEKISGLSGSEEYNSASDNIYPPLQPGYYDKSGSSPLLFGAESPPPPLQRAVNFFPSHFDNRAITPPPLARTLHSEPYNSSSMDAHAVQHGMRTPPPSGGKDVDLAHYAAGISTPLGRSNNQNSSAWKRSVHPQHHYYA